MNQPKIDTANPDHGTDETGRRWSSAMANEHGIMAGYDSDGAFHCYVDPETLYIGALATIVQLQQQIPTGANPSA